MLQKLNFDDDHDEDSDFAALQQSDQSHLLRPSFYWQVFKRRWLYFFVPFVVVAAAGIAVAFLWPPTYRSQGRILVEAQQIPTELVRPTVTSAAQERVQVLEQRTLTRENLLAIVDKFQLFADKRSLLSPTQLVELMKKNAKIEPLDEPLSFAKIRTRNDNPTIVFTVSFEYSDSATAAAVANELVTRILNEDLRDRTSRASDTVKFLTRQVQKLQSEATALDEKISQVKASQGLSTSSSPNSNAPDAPVVRLAQLKLEMTQKSSLYSEKHPLMQSLKKQIEALQKSIASQQRTQQDAAAQDGQNPQVSVEALEAQKDNLQKSLELASAKLDAARMGELLEKNQQSEKLEVIEQPTAPQEPAKPNRPKLMLMSVLAAFAAGGGLVFLLEMMDKSIRRASDLYKVVDNRLIVTIPYITTGSELRQRKTRMKVVAGAIVALVIVAGFVVMEVLPPLDLMIAKARVGIFKQ
jgi:uncharacterized protein involved in exopolysaccharide biosynthesis